MRAEQIDFERICGIARQAGAAILGIYEQAFEVETKADDTPLTEADRAAHTEIVRGLAEVTPEIPVLSEGGKDIPFARRRNWQHFWLVDPLDGTKEFIKRNGEFTVNIALVEQGEVIAGVVYVPVADILYLGRKGGGAWRETSAGGRESISVKQTDPAKGLTVVQSRSHPSPELEGYLQNFRVAETVSVGSSLKFCAVAEGRADLYPRLGPTMEWDTAAGQAVVEAAGGTVLTLDGQALRYNKNDLLNPHFVVRGWCPEA